MDSIFLKNKKYIKASVIAKELGYTSDYIGQLCRGGKVEAELVGRTWYVADEAIREHKKNRYRSTVKATKRSLEKMVLAEPQHKSEAIGYKVRVNYETDQAALIPQPKKEVAKDVTDEEEQLQVVSDDNTHEVRLKDLTREPKTGSLRINVATEEPAPAEPIEILTAKPTQAVTVVETKLKQELVMAEVANPKKPAEAVRFSPASVAAVNGVPKRTRLSSSQLVLVSTFIALTMALGINLFSSRTEYSSNQGEVKMTYVFDTTSAVSIYNTFKNKIISL
jgi:hypothetical protein